MKRTPLLRSGGRRVCRQLLVSGTGKIGPAINFGSLVDVVKLKVLNSPNGKLTQSARVDATLVGLHCGHLTTTTTTTTPI